MSTLTKRQRNELLVHGYIRSETQNHALAIPQDILHLMFLWYHTDSFFMKAGDLCTINEAKNMVEYKNEGKTKIDGSFAIINSCYGSLEMPSVSDRDIEYEFRLKISKLSDDMVIGIGIDNAECKWINKNFISPSSREIVDYQYGYISKGKLYSYKERGINYGQGYDQGDTIRMVYNPYKSILCFQTNDIKHKEIENVHSAEGFSYRLAIYMGYNGNQVIELLD